MIGLFLAMNLAWADDSPKSALAIMVDKPAIKETVSAADKVDWYAFSSNVAVAVGFDGGAKCDVFYDRGNATLTRIGDCSAATFRVTTPKPGSDYMVSVTWRQDIGGAAAYCLEVRAGGKLRCEASAASEVDRPTPTEAAAPASREAVPVPMKPAKLGPPYRMVDSYDCGDGSLVVGLNDTKNVAICVTLPKSYKQKTKIQDSLSKVSTGPKMHGCPSGYFIQRIGSQKDYTCVRYERDGVLVGWGAPIHDGRGPANGTESTIYGAPPPTMHVCPRGYAVVGWHQEKNDLYCAQY